MELLERHARACLQCNNPSDPLLCLVGWLLAYELMMQTNFV